MTKNLKQILLSTRDLIASGWTQNVHARNTYGLPVPYFSEEATCFCLNGALLRVVRSEMENSLEKGEKVFFAVEDLLLACQSAYITWNDAPGRTQVEVLSLLDRAIALAPESPL